MQHVLRPRDRARQLRDASLARMRIDTLETQHGWLDESRALGEALKSDIAVVGAGGVEESMDAVDRAMGRISTLAAQVRATIETHEALATNDRRLSLIGLAGASTVIVLPMIEGEQLQILNQAVDRRLRHKAPRPIVITGYAEARLRQRLAVRQNIVREEFARFPNFEALSEEAWAGSGALTKAISSVELDEIPIAAIESDVLRDLPEDSKLYINGHGGDGDSFFQYAWEDGSRKNLPMDAVAGWLEQAGLPRDRHYDIRFRMCHSACPGPDDRPAMAGRFRGVMQDFGYGNGDVSGYLGNVIPMPLLHDDGLRHSVVTDAHGDGAPSRRSENRITYKADGSVIDSRAAKASVGTPETERSDAPPREEPS
jgi:hypothetical protein